MTLDACEIEATLGFDRWMAGLDDHRGKTQILARIRRLSLGNAGHHRMLKLGIGEMKLRPGPGYRVYFMMRARRVVLLLCGGDKATQREDIALALRLAARQENPNDA